MVYIRRVNIHKKTLCYDENFLLYNLKHESLKSCLKLLSDKVEVGTHGIIILTSQGLSTHGFRERVLIPCLVRMDVVCTTRNPYTSKIDNRTWVCVPTSSFDEQVLCRYKRPAVTHTMVGASMFVCLFVFCV